MLQCRIRSCLANVPYNIGLSLSFDKDEGYQNFLKLNDFDPEKQLIFTVAHVLLIDFTSYTYQLHEK